VNGFADDEAGRIRGQKRDDVTDLARFADTRAAIIAQGFDEIASGTGLSLLRRR